MLMSHIIKEQMNFLKKNKMDKDTIKKELYKQKPIAEVDFERGDYTHWSTVVIIEGTEEIVEFKIPIQEDPGVTEIPAQLLIRWMV